MGRDRRSYAKQNDQSHRRKSNRKAKVRKPSPREIETRSDSVSTGCTPRDTIIPDQTTTKKKTSRAWENIVLHYLSKLKNVWRPSRPANENEMAHPITPGNREDSATKFRRERHNEHRRMHYNKYRPPSPTVSSTIPSEFCLSGKRKAFNIVANAIEYGLANGIVSKNGNFFWMSHRLNKRLRKRRSVCSNCRSCRDGIHTLASASNSTVNIEKDDNPGHALAVNRSRPKVSKVKSILQTNDLKVKQVASAKLRSKPHSARSVRSLKSRKSRVGGAAMKSIPKESVALARSKSKKKSLTKVPSTMRGEYVSRLVRDITKERDCRCSRCMKKYMW